MQYIIAKQIELSGSTSAKDIGLMWNGDVAAVDERDRRIAVLEENLDAEVAGTSDMVAMTETALTMMQEQMSMLRQTQEVIMQQLGMQMPASTETNPEIEEGYSTTSTQPSNVIPASA
jgi:hypothetical protein